MNIGIFTDTYYPQINGVVTSCCMLKAELEKLGHRVYIFTTTDPNAKEKLPRVFRMPSMPFVFLPSHRMTYIYSPKLLLNIKKLKLDLIHTQTEFSLGIFGKVISELYRIPQVHTYHTMYEDYVHYVANGHLITPKMAKLYSRIFCNRAQAVVAPVLKTQKSLREYGVVRPIDIIPTGLSFDNFKRGKFSDLEIQETKQSLGLDPADPAIVYVGRVAQEKSFDVVIKSMPRVLERVPNAKLVVVGNGPLINEYKELCASLGVAASVIFAGPRPWDQIAMYYQLGDVFTTASTSETQGLTYLEAMAAKVPVVAKKDESIEGILINNETGFVFENDEDLPDALVHVLQNKDKMSEIIDKGFENIQRLSAEQFAKNIEKLYFRVLEETRSKPKKIIIPLKFMRR